MRWLRANAWRFLPSQALEKWAQATFDARHGTDTSGFAELGSLDIDSPNKRHGERYQPSPVRSFRQVLRRLGADLSRFTFIDVGSGKGRTLLLAAQLPFRAVIGVEFSAALHACALANIGRFPVSRGRPAISVHADATQFEWPPGPLVLYFFNPFGEAVMRQVLANLTASLRRQPRPVFAICLYMGEATLFDGLAGFRRCLAWRRYLVYEFQPADPR